MLSTSQFSSSTAIPFNTPHGCTIYIQRARRHSDVYGPVFTRSGFVYQLNITTIIIIILFVP